MSREHFNLFYLFFNLFDKERIIILSCPELNRLKIVMKLCTSIGTRLGAQVRDFSACFGYFTKWDRNYFETSWDHFEFSLLFTRGINGGYYVAAQRHEIALRVLKNISRVSAPFELSYDEFKATKCWTETFVFVECYVVKLLSCVAWPL